jgi:hypothetical protein
MIGDIKILEQASMTGRGAREYNVAAGATTINAGEPVARALGATTVTAAATSTPVVGTDYYVGVAATTSTQTASVAGKVYVYPLSSGTTYIISPKVAATWDTQAEYNALVGKRVLIDLTSSTYTILAADSANNGCVIQDLDIAKYPGKVAFAFRAATSDLS